MQLRAASPLQKTIEWLGGGVGWRIALRGVGVWAQMGTAAGRPRNDLLLKNSMDKSEKSQVEHP